MNIERTITRGMLVYAATHLLCALVCATTLYVSTFFYMPMWLVGWVYGAWVAGSVFMVTTFWTRGENPDTTDAMDASMMWMAYIVVYIVVWANTGGMLALFIGIKH